MNHANLNAYTMGDYYNLFASFVPAFDGEGEGAGEGAGEGEGEGNAGGSADKTFTQEDLNRILADDRRKHKNVVTGLESEIQALTQRSNLSVNDRKDLETRLSELNSQLLTKEELAQKEKDRITRDYTEKVDNLTKQAETWQKRYEETRIVSALSDAAAKHKAFNPNQIVTMLRDNTRVVEVMDGDQSTGNFEPRVKLKSINKDGKPVELDLTPDEAVKHMSEQEDSLNLFKSDAASGYGGHGKKPGPADAANLAKDPVAYRAARKQGTI